MSVESVRRRRGLAAAIAVAAVAAVAAGVLLAGTGAPAAPAAVAGDRIQVVAAESQYASILAQVGGRYVQATGIMSNPNVDPHTFEASTLVAREVAGARLIVQNGLGYDAFMNQIENASPNAQRIVITVAGALGYGPHTLNPHLWYSPATMPRVAALVASALATIAPRRAAYFRANASRFTASLAPWKAALTRLETAFHGAPVAVTEPVADDLLQAAGLSIRTPWPFQAAVMNGTDPSPEAVAAETRLLSDGPAKVRVFVYNQQAVDATTQRLLALAKAHHIPVVGVYETMPPGDDYQTWMVAETNALYNALRYHRSEATMS